jgi:hypothetical protein
VAEKLDPLQARLDLADAELNKVVLRHPTVLNYNHDSLVAEKLDPLQAASTPGAD